MGRTNPFDENQQLDQLIYNITHTNHTQETVPSVPEHPQAAITRKNPLFEKFKEKKTHIRITAFVCGLLKHKGNYSPASKNHLFWLTGQHSCFRLVLVQIFHIQSSCTFA